ncbi:MAG: hypothetical protein JSW08_01210 [archaeon]|nr:MAG: hypothetical protein JSW08_01210 [archaeon]
MNRKAAEINITTVIVIILAILVLVILALYFTGGMKSLWGQITGQKSAWDQTDVENAQMVCGIRCSAQDSDFFCNHEFNIRKADENEQPEAKHCWESPIKAHTLEDCKRVGYTKDICEVA